MATVIPRKLIPNYVSASIAVSFGGLLNGYDTGCIGAISHMRQFTETMGRMPALLLGITVSMIMLTGTLPSVFAGHLADRHGRLKIILPGAILFAMGAALQGTAHKLTQFIVGRALGGFGQGMFLANIAVYITEIAPSQKRGRLVALPQFAATAGVCLGYFSCYGTVSVTSSFAWRLPYVVQGIVAIMLALTCLFLPESPRWLALRGRSEEAVLALRMLDFNMEEARGFLSVAQQQPSLRGWQNFALLFRRNYRPRTFLALFLLGMVQLGGIDAITYYAPVLFGQAGLASDNASFLASGISSILMLLISIPAFMLADRWGRRTSAISGGIGLSGCMVVIGSLYAAEAVHPSGFARWVVIVAVYVFGLTYCATWGIVSKIYASEIQPGNTRAAANSVAMGLSFFTNWLVALITPILLNASAFGAYFLFGGIALCTTGVLAAYMPETRGRSLENIQEAFHRPAISSVTRYLRPLIPSLRHRVVNNPANEEIEMEPQNQTSPAEAISISHEGVTRSLRLDMASA
ncbi:hypothetical protein DL767_003108 [Monosporascus sp. MG133]|nr:hypothetical protein DL767_003108 [Monosporascus sp. MG133]